MGETFYVVEVLMNGRRGTLPSKFLYKDDAVAFAIKMRSMSDQHVNVETRIYEAREIEF